jgi:hypothetical protein
VKKTKKAKIKKKVRGEAGRRRDAMSKPEKPAGVWETGRGSDAWNWKAAAGSARHQSAALHA